MKRRIVVLAACCVSLATWAGDVRYFSEDQVPTSAEIAALLAAPASVSTPAAAQVGPSHGGRTRLVRLIDSQEAPHRVEAAPPRSDPQPRVQVARLSSVGSIALALRFDADANRIQGHHLAQLDALAAGIKRLPDNALITITGHTDAYGSALYNIDLSLRRAMAVRAYLVQVHGIPARRLVAMGKGKSEPLNRANPFAPENRRVQVHAEYDVA